MNDTGDAFAADLLRLLRSGVRVAQLRVLRVECEHNRKLLEVYRVNGRTALVARPTLWVNPQSDNVPWNAPPAEPATQPVGGHMPDRSGDRVMIVEAESGDDLAELHVASSCCTRTITLGWVRRQIDASARRVVLRADES